MTVFDILEFVGALSLFLFGMKYMGDALEKKAGGSLSALLSRFTSNKYSAFLFGLVATVVIQSSSAATVMVVGLVNSGVMTMSQSVGVIIGANVGTTVTAWILSLTGISSGNVFVQLLTPSSFVPVVAFVGIILFFFVKSSRKKDVGMILLGFSVLMFGMERAADSVSGLKDVPAFTALFVLFKNPVLGILAGALLTAIVQSSTASVGILQALSMTGSVSVAAALPIILGQNIGTCVTTLVSSIGADKNARRAAMIHLNFNLLGSALIMLVFYPLNAMLKFGFVNESATALSIALIHTVCNVITTAVFLPFSSVLEKLATRLVKSKEGESKGELILDERLFVNPGVAISQCRSAVIKTAHEAIFLFEKAIRLIENYNEKDDEFIRKGEALIDRNEDIIDTYLVKLNGRQLTVSDSREVTKLLHIIALFERISDHAVHLTIYSSELRSKKLSLSQAAKAELKTICDAVLEAIDLTVTAFCRNDSKLASTVEPLEQVVDKLTDKAKSNHIKRFLNGECENQTGLIYSDILNLLERVSDHCSDIAASVIEIPLGVMDIHEYINSVKTNDPFFHEKYEQYKAKYAI